MKLFLVSIIFIISNNSFSNDECSENYSPTKTIEEVAGRSCLAGVKPKALYDKLYDVKDFCLKCNNKILNHLNGEAGVKDERAYNYGKATIGELQKELTFIAHDLLQMRSSYQINFDSARSSKHCSTENITPPNCLKPQQKEAFTQDINKLQASIATDIATILTPADKNDTDNSCQITDKEILFLSTKFREKLLTPEFINTLKSYEFNKDENISDVLAKDPKWKVTISELKKHPLFKTLLADHKKMRKFLKNIDPKKSVVANLYAETSEEFGENIKERCKVAYRKTNDYLKSIYCDKTPPFVADDFDSLQAVIGSPIAKENETDLENKLQMFCSQKNTQSEKTVSFSIVHKDLNGSNPNSKEPITSFRRLFHKNYFTRDKSSICTAKDKCGSTEKSNPICIMSDFLEKSRASAEFKEMAEHSSKDINTVLGSMIGKGLPYSEEKKITDPIALKILRDEHILPGGATNDNKTVQQDVSTFEKKVSASAKSKSNTQTIPDSSSQMAAPAAQGKTAEMTPDIQNSIPEKTTEKTMANDTTAKQTQDSPKKFMNNNDEFMRRLKPNGPVASKTKIVNNNNNQGSSTTIDSSSPQTSFEATDIKDTVSEKPATVINNFIRSPEPVGKKADIDPLPKPKKSTNGPLIEANEKRQLNEAALLASGPASSSFTVNDPASLGKPKIETLAEAAGVKEYQAKLQVLLNAQSKELSVEKQGESFLVKLKSYEIKVLYDETKKAFEAICLDTKIPKKYLDKITEYFNTAAKKPRIDRRLELKKIIQTAQTKDK